MAKLVIDEVGDTYGVLLFTGLAAYPTNRQAFFYCKLNGQTVAQAFKGIEAEDDSDIDITFRNLTPLTYYTVDYEVYESLGGLVAAENNAISFTTTEAELEITAVYVSEDPEEVEYDRNTGQLKFTIAVRVKNANPYSYPITLQLIFNENEPVEQYVNVGPKSTSTFYFYNVTAITDPGLRKKEDESSYIRKFPCNVYVYYYNLDGDYTVIAEQDSSFEVEFKIVKEIIYFNGIGPLTSDLVGTPVKDSVLATEWNRMCEAIEGLINYGGKQSGDVIKQSEVQTMLNTLERETNNSLTSVGQLCNLSYFMRIEDLYNNHY